MKLAPCISLLPLFAAGCWMAQGIAADGDGDDADSQETESGGMTDPEPETDPDEVWTFEVMASGTAEDLTGVFGFGDTEVWAVGRSGTILRYDGNDDLEWVAEPFPTDAQGAHLGDIHGWPNGRLVAAGSNGTVIVRLFGGGWAATPTGISADLHAVCDRGEEGILAVGDDGLVLSWDGEYWSAVSTGLSQTLMDISCGSVASWAVGHTTDAGMSSVVLRIEDGAATAIEHPIAHYMYAVTAADDADIAAVAGQYQTSQEEGPRFEIHTMDSSGWQEGPTGDALILDMEARLDGDLESAALFMVGRTVAEGSETEYPIIYYKASGTSLFAQLVYLHDIPGAFRGVWRDQSTGHGAVYAVGDQGLIVRGRRESE